MSDSEIRERGKGEENTATVSASVEAEPVPLGDQRHPVGRGTGELDPGQPARQGPGQPGLVPPVELARYGADVAGAVVVLCVGALPPGARHVGKASPHVQKFPIFHKFPLNYVN